MNTIQKLWKKEQIPIKDGIYFNSGKAFELYFTSYPSPILKVKEPFDLEEFLEKNQEELSYVDITCKLKLPNNHTLVSGEGSYGSEGFIGYLDKNKEPIWLIYSESFNPIISLTKLDSKIKADSSLLGISFILDIDNPLDIKIFEPEKLNKKQTIINYLDK